jgi:hypothetical protein
LDTLYAIRVTRLSGVGVGGGQDRNRSVGRHRVALEHLVVEQRLVDQVLEGLADSTSWLKIAPALPLSPVGREVVGEVVDPVQVERVEGEITQSGLLAPATSGLFAGAVMSWVGRYPKSRFPATSELNSEVSEVKGTSLNTLIVGLTGPE